MQRWDWRHSRRYLSRRVFGSIQESRKLHHQLISLVPSTEENCTTYNFGEQTKCFQILENVTGLCCNQEHVEFFHWLINITNRISFHECMLFSWCHQFWKRSKKPFDSRLRHFHKLSWNDRWNRQWWSLNHSWCLHIHRTHFFQILCKLLLILKPTKQIRLFGHFPHFAAILFIPFWWIVCCTFS